MDKIINSCKVSRKGAPFCKPNIAKQDIVCYKIIERRGNDGYSLYDPNYKYEEPIESGAMIKGQGKYVKNNWFKRIFLGYPKETFVEESIVWNNREKWYDITFGFIHTLSYCPENITNYLPLYCNKDSHFELWECIIPQRTLYYQANCRGSHYESNNSYASKVIIFQNKIDECIYSGWNIK